MNGALRQQPAIAGRALSFVYFGAVRHPSVDETARGPGRAPHRHDALDTAEEITFECEPGTLTESKLTAIRGMGVTRLSLGVENFDDHILEINGRAHRSPRSQYLGLCPGLDIPTDQHRSDRGSARGDDENWGTCIEKTLELSPDSVTIYQRSCRSTRRSAATCWPGRAASTSTSRAGRRNGAGPRGLRGAGARRYHVASAYTAVKDPTRTHFVYRDRLWEAPTSRPGVASFGT